MVAAKLRTFFCTPNKTLLALPPVAGTLTRGLTRFARILAHVLAPQSLVLEGLMNKEMEFKPVVSVVKTQFQSDSTTFVDEVKLSESGLIIIMKSKGWSAKVNFEATYGFRVLDEGDLSEFWSVCTLKDGWCFEVMEGGWNSLELKRAHFVSGKLYDIKEYLIVGLNECVSVLGHEPPTIAGI